MTVERHGSGALREHWLVDTRAGGADIREEGSFTECR